jgi:hypothetical protein
MMHSLVRSIAFIWGLALLSGAVHAASDFTTRHPPVFWPQLADDDATGFAIRLQTVKSPSETIYSANPCIYQKRPSDCPLTFTTRPGGLEVSRTAHGTAYATTCTQVSSGGDATCTERIHPEATPTGGIETVRTLPNRVVSVFPGPIQTGVPFATPTERPAFNATVSLHFPVPLWLQYGKGGYQKPAATQAPTITASVISTRADAVVYGLAPCSRWETTEHCPLLAQTGATITAGISTFEYANTYTFMHAKEKTRTHQTDTTACSVVPQVTARCWVKSAEADDWLFMNPVKQEALRPISLRVVDHNDDDDAASSTARVSTAMVGLVAALVALMLL